MRPECVSWKTPGLEIKEQARQSNSKRGQFITPPLIINNTKDGDGGGLSMSMSFGWINGEAKQLLHFKAWAFSSLCYLWNLESTLRKPSVSYLPLVRTG